MVISNQNGRAMEYSFYVKIKGFSQENKIQFEEGEISKNSIERDKAHYNNLDEETKQDFEKFSSSLLYWIYNKFNLKSQKRIFIDREIDYAGVLGNVIDIYLKLTNEIDEEKTLNLSFKNHHNALKHPRLSRIPFNCGITDKSILEDYKNEIDEVWDLFISKSKEINPDATLFREVKEKDSSFVDENLYLKINKIVINLLNKEVKNHEENVAKFFSFMVGTNFNFYTIKNEEKNILIKNFSNISTPKSFTVELLKSSTFLIKFDNNWNVSFRLHTASSRMYKKNGKINPSVKYDVICLNIDEVLDIEKISK